MQKKRLVMNLWRKFKMFAVKQNIHLTVQILEFWNSKVLNTIASNLKVAKLLKNCIPYNNLSMNKKVFFLFLSDVLDMYKNDKSDGWFEPYEERIWCVISFHKMQLLSHFKIFLKSCLTFAYPTWCFGPLICVLFVPEKAVKSSS